MFKLMSSAKKQTFRQDYSPKKFIEGIKLTEVKRFTGEDGSFNEIVRLDQKGRVVVPDELAGFVIRQINHSRVMPGIVKAWHFHYQQDEIWFIHPEAKVIVGLLDLREGSKTKKLSMKLSLGDGRTYLVYIPRGVAHGLSNPYQKEATMTYLVNNWFNGEDEQRLPYDFLVGKEFWEIEKG